MSPGFVLLYIALTGVFAAGALMTYRERGWTWVSIGLLVATFVLGFGSIASSLGNSVSRLAQAIAAALA